MAYLDNSQLNKPRTNSATVYVVSDGESSLATKEHLMEKYPSMFNEEVGLLEDEYHIHLDPQVEPVQHGRRRVLVAVREGLRKL